jgi:hypothetical protein
MKIWTNAIVAGSLLAAGVIVKKLVRARRNARTKPIAEIGASAGQHDLAYNAISELKKDLAVIASESGIANVDPEPISHVAGEGIDLEGDVRAHEEIAEQRDRLPRV